MSTPERDSLEEAAADAQFELHMALERLNELAEDFAKAIDHRDDLEYQLEETRLDIENLEADLENAEMAVEDAEEALSDAMDALEEEGD